MVEEDDDDDDEEEDVFAKVALGPGELATPVTRALLRTGELGFWLYADMVSVVSSDDKK